MPRVQLSASSFSALPRTRSTSGMAAKRSGSTCAAQPVTTMRGAGLLAAGAADGLARLAHGLGRHRAGVDDDRVAAIPAASAARRIASDSARLSAAAEGEHLDRHQAAPANNAGGRTPSCSSSTGPVISTWPSVRASG